MLIPAPPYNEPSAKDSVGTVCELFAGVGGFRIALARSGLRTVFSNQWEPSTKSQHASDCYVHNFGARGHTCVDIHDLVSQHLELGGKVIPKTDIVCGGFPCQDYSVAKSLNTAHGIEGKKGVLWWDIHRLVEANRPRYVFLENVDRLLKSPARQRGRDFAVMLATLGALGYRVEWRVVNSADYGYPQRRLRVFIVATRTRRKRAVTESEAVGEVTGSGILARALPVEGFDGPVGRVNLTDPPDELSDGFNLGGGASPFANGGVSLGGVAFTMKVRASRVEPCAVLRDVLVDDADVPDEYWIPNERIREWRYLKGAKSIERTHRESGSSYRYAEGGMAFPDPLDRPSRTILTGEGGTSPSRFKHVIETARGMRRLVPVELERLSGFPDNWTRFLGEGREASDARRAFFVGNALVVGLVERVGRVIADDLAALRR